MLTFLKVDDEGKSASEWTDNSGYSEIELYPDGSYKAFVPNIDTEWAIAKEIVKLKADCAVRLFANGNLERCVLCDDTKLPVFGVVALVAKDVTLEFHANGNLRSLVLAARPSWVPWKSRKWTYRGVAYDAGTKLQFSEEGAVVSAEKPGSR